MSSKKRPSTYKMSELVAQIDECIVEIVGKELKALLLKVGESQISLCDKPIHKLDIYFALRSARDFFRRACNAFPFEFNTNRLRAYTARELAEILIEITILTRTGNLPVSERIKPRDFNPVVANGQNLMELVCVIEAFFSALIGLSFEHSYVDVKAHVINSVKEKSEGRIKLPYSSEVQLKMASEFRTRYGTEKLVLLGEYMLQEFAQKLKDDIRITDEEWRMVRDQFLKAVNTTIQA